MTSKLRRVLIGFSSPLGYYYDLETEKGHPGPILEAPLGYFLFYDEIWFINRKLCPYNMVNLPYVHFVDEELLKEGLPKDFIKGTITPPKLSDFPFSKWTKQVRETFITGARYDNHSRTQKFGELSVLPTPGNYANFIIDNYIATRFDLELAENTINAEWLTEFRENILLVQTTQKILTERIPSLQTIEGPYHPIIEDFRKDSLLESYRNKVTEACQSHSYDQLPILCKKLGDEYDRMAAELAATRFGVSRLVDGGVSLSVGQVPVAGNVSSAIQGVREISGYFRDKKKRGWVGFIARTISKAYKQIKE